MQSDIAIDAHEVSVHALDVSIIPLFLVTSDEYVDERNEFTIFLAPLLISNDVYSLVSLMIDPQLLNLVNVDLVIDICPCPLFKPINDVKS